MPDSATIPLVDRRFDQLDLSPAAAHFLPQFLYSHEYAACRAQA
ncbi:MAG: hypothetical protein ACR2F6_08480 [Mycobacteriales bacterium]